MTSSAPLPRLPDYSRPVTLAAIPGVVLLLGGVLLGAYSVFVAAGNPYLPTGSDADLPGTLGRFAIGFGTAVLLLQATLCWSRRARAAGLGNPAAVLSPVLLVAWVVVTWKLRVLSTASRLIETHAAFPQLPTAVAAWILVLVGTVLCLGTALAPPRVWTVERRPAAIAAGSGVLVCAVVAASALYLGDDSRFVDASTAADAVAPSAPHRLGTERSRFTVAADDRVIFGGHGYFVGSSKGVTAYNADGTPRWHHLRPDATEDTVGHNTDSMRHFPAENVLLTYWHRLGWKAFDTSTGRVLWTESEFSRDSGRFGRVLPDQFGAPFPARGEDGVLARYDARTGQRLWQVTKADSPCSSIPTFAMTPTAVYLVAHCPGDEVVTVVLAMSPATGETLARREIAVPARTPPQVTVVDDAVAITWALGSDEPSQLRFGSVRQLESAALTERVHVVAAADGDTISRPAGGQTLVLHEPAANLVREIPGWQRNWDYAGKPILTADEIMTIDTDVIRTWRRADLVETTAARRLVSCTPTRLVRAAGRTFVVCGTGAGSMQTIVVFRP
ncbi:outer membrane protein assembly factor BamB family protein [Nocardia rhizosphaerae]|uniref:PQQ-binding-like beta-propeller repeat protein n=1 Tax=Nocardia rhizosphaerae TaxID=1691571 RepID=A0ABV8L6E2_9NOCA